MESTELHDKAPCFPLMQLHSNLNASLSYSFPAHPWLPAVPSAPSQKIKGCSHFLHPDSAPTATSCLYSKAIPGTSYVTRWTFCVSFVFLSGRSQWLPARVCLLPLRLSPQTAKARSALLLQRSSSFQLPVFLIAHVNCNEGSAITICDC